MRLARRTDYALRVLMALALEDETRTVAEMAAALRVSEHHLAKVAKDLRRRGYLSTRRGRGGGFQLDRRPAEIRLGELVRELEDMPLVECLEPGGRCPLRGPCVLEGALRDARDAFLASLDHRTLADLVAPRQPLTRLLHPSHLEAR